MDALKRKKLDRLTTGIFGLLAAGLCAGGYLAFRPASAPALQPVATPSAQVAPEPAAPVAKSPDTPVAPVQAPSQLKAPFKLSGVVYNAAGGSFVSIELAGKAGIYHAGDRLAEGWSISAIGIDSVALVRNGDALTLNIDRAVLKAPETVVARTDLGKAPAGTVSPPNTNIPGRMGLNGASLHGNVTYTSSVVTAKPPPEARNSDTSVLIDPNMAELGRQDPRALMKGVECEPIVEQGKMQGVQINNVPRDSYAARAGLASGDAILEINGKPIGSLDQAWNLYNQFRDGNSVNVTIERAGKRKVVTYYVP